MVRVGTHTSVAGGLEYAFERSAKIGGQTLQVFAKSPRGRDVPRYPQEQYKLGRAERQKRDQTGGLVHSNYLANLAKPSDEIQREIASIVQDFEYARNLGYEAVNVHVGKMKGRESLDEAMTNMARNVETILQEVRDRGFETVQFLFENTAGQSGEIGSTLEELGYFHQHYLHDLPVKFTIDTAHCRGGGIDLSRWGEFIDQFNETIGIQNLFAIHLNDSKVPLGAKLDRHASLGRGFIGWSLLKPIIEWAHSHERGLFIETGEEELRPDEITKVRQIAAGEVDWIDEFHALYFKTQFVKKYADGGLKQQGLFG